MSVISSSIAPLTNVSKLNGSNHTQVDQSESREKLNMLVFSAKTLLFEAYLLSGSDRLTKLNEAGSILKIACAIQPNNPFILRSIGQAFLLQAHFLSGFPRLFTLCQARDNFEKSLTIKPEHTSTLRSLTKLNEVRTKLETSLSIAPNNASKSHSLDSLLKNEKPSG